MSTVYKKLSLAGGKFQDASGNRLSNGLLIWYLSHDSNVTVLGGPTGSQVAAGISIKIRLDVNGNVLPGYSLWPNDQLAPSGSYYTVRAYDSNGIEVWRFPQQFVLQGYVSGATVDLGVLTPQQP